MICTYYEFQVFREGESQNREHAFERVVGVIDSVGIMTSYDRQHEQWVVSLTQQRGRVYPDNANTPG
jgi:hypothetical protein